MYDTGDPSSPFPPLHMTQGLCFSLGGPPSSTREHAESAGRSGNCCVPLQLANIALSALFAAEMLIKHMALGLVRYWKNGFNALDGAIVISSILEIILMASSQHSESSGLRAFRLIRIFRTIKLLRQFKGLHRLLSTVIKVSILS